ncbi:MAG: site-specific integrase, partial [Arcobacter sp.]|nr:site-specific integrase [Arcobacter sp.]
MNNELLLVFEEYLSISKMLGSNTTSSYIGDLSSLQEFIGEKSLTSLEMEDIIGYLSQFSNKRTLNRKLSSINTFFKFCHEYNFEHSKIS